MEGVAPATPRVVQGRKCPNIRGGRGLPPSSFAAQATAVG